MALSVAQQLIRLPQTIRGSTPEAKRAPYSLAEQNVRSAACTAKKLRFTQQSHRDPGTVVP